MNEVVNGKVQNLMFLEHGPSETGALYFVDDNNVPIFRIWNVVEYKRPGITYFPHPNRKPSAHCIAKAYREYFRNLLLDQHLSYSQVNSSRFFTW